MNEIKALHRHAMEALDAAFIAKQKGFDHQYEVRTAQALQLEIKAAELLKDRKDTEPTRAILFRSAASIAMELGKHKLAEQLISTALKGKPPLELKEELEELRNRNRLITQEADRKRGRIKRPAHASFPWIQTGQREAVIRALLFGRAIVKKSPAATGYVKSYNKRFVLDEKGRPIGIHQILSAQPNECSDKTEAVKNFPRGMVVMRGLQSMASGRAGAHRKKQGHRSVSCNMKNNKVTRILRKSRGSFIRFCRYMQIIEED